MPFTPSVNLSNYPLDPSRPRPYSCTISRPAGPGWRYPLVNPWFNEFAVDVTDKGLRDLSIMHRMRRERVVNAGDVFPIVMGRVPKASSAATLKIDGFEPTQPPTVIPTGTLTDLLVPLELHVESNRRFFYVIEGQPVLGVTFNADLRAGEQVVLWVNNTNPASQINGQTLRFQLFFYCDSAYAIEVGRKGRPGYHS